MPSSIDGAKVLLAADARAAVPTLRTRHFVGGFEAGKIAGLAVVQYGNENEVYLFYCDDQWRTITDTLHADVRAAVKQAEFEFSDIAFSEPTS